MNILLRQLHKYDITGRVLAIVLACSIRPIAWPLYLWLRESWLVFDYPLASTHVLGAVYFAAWTFVMELLLNEFEPYRLMIHDAVLAGILTATAVALTAEPVRQQLSRLGFALAPWIIFLTATLFVVSRVPRLRYRRS